MNRNQQIAQELENLKGLFEIAPVPQAEAVTPPTIAKRFEAIEAQGFRYIYDQRDWFTGIWINDEHDYILNWCGGSYPNIREAVESAERFIGGMARIQR